MAIGRSCAGDGRDGAAREIAPVTSLFCPLAWLFRTGGLNSDGTLCVVWVKSNGVTVMGIFLLGSVATGAMVAGSLGSASGLVAAATVAGACVPVLAATSVSPLLADRSASVSGAVAVWMLGRRKSKILPAIWIEPTTAPAMLAAMNSDLTRFIILLRSDGCSVSSISTGSAARGARPLGACTAAWAARRAAAMKPDFPLGVAAGGAPAECPPNDGPRAASEAAMRAAGWTRKAGAPDPGSSG